MERKYPHMRIRFRRPRSRLRASESERAKRVRSYEKSIEITWKKRDI